MAESSSVTPKWTCLTSQNKALLYLRALLGKHSGQLINTSLVECSMENILCRATISDFQTWISDFYSWSGKLWVQGCSESEEREDIHGESSICAWGEVSLLGRLQEHKCVQSHLRLEHEFSTNPLLRVSDCSCSRELPGLWQGSSWGALHSTSISFSHGAKKSFFQRARSREFNWTQ